MLEVSARRRVYDVCIVGSGAGGGTAAKVLTEGGLSVVILEAGPRLNPDKDFKEHVWPDQLAHRGVGKADARPESSTNSWRQTVSGRFRVSRTPQRPDRSSAWFRSRIEGGRTNHWGRIALRFGPADFKPHSTDGMGDDWPITYEELSPYYDKVESYIGVFGSKENVPNSPDGMFLPPPKPRCTETLVKKACDSLNITCIPSRLAILTKTLNDRDPCHYCAQCGRGCRTASNFSSSQVMIPPAAATGASRCSQRDGSRDRAGKQRQGRGGFVCRQGYGDGAASVCAGHCGSGECLRVCAPAAEFSISEVSRTGWRILLARSAAT